MVSNLCPKEQEFAACREQREQGFAFRSHSMGAVRSLPSKPLHHNIIYQALFVLEGVYKWKKKWPKSYSAPSMAAVSPKSTGAGGALNSLHQAEVLGLRGWRLQGHKEDLGE